MNLPPGTVFAENSRAIEHLRRILASDLVRTQHPECDEGEDA